MGDVSSNMIKTTHICKVSPTEAVNVRREISKPKGFSYFVAGGLSGVVSSVVSQPFDVIKTNMIGTRSANRNGTQMRMINTTLLIIRNEGFFGLWRGTIPTIWRVLPGASIYYSLLNKFKEVATHVPKRYHNESVENFLIGAGARSVATIFLNPITVIKTRFELAHLSPEQQTMKDGGILKTLHSIYKKEGLRRGLFSGLLPTLARDVPYAGLSFLFYSKTKHIMTILLMPNDVLARGESAITSVDTPFYITLTSGAVGGMIGSMITYPFDVIRTRMQLKSHYSGVINAFTTIVQEEGLSTLFRGIVPRLMKRTLASALSWSALENVVDIIDKIYHHKG